MGPFFLYIVFLPKRSLSSCGGFPFIMEGLPPCKDIEGGSLCDEILVK